MWHERERERERAREREREREASVSGIGRYAKFKIFQHVESGMRPSVEWLAEIAVEEEEEEEGNDRSGVP
jgi:hypothetical protein